VNTHLTLGHGLDVHAGLDECRVDAATRDRHRSTRTTPFLGRARERWRGTFLRILQKRRLLARPLLRTPLLREDVPMRELFRRFATRTSEWVGTPTAFVIGVALIVLWALTGPLFGYSDSWQLVVNTATTIITFLMVFLIQATQNRDAKAIHLKLDELLRGVHGARTAMVALENSTDEELAQFQEEFSRLHDRLSRRGKVA
jgi:low affinity Fe/Cu permease